MFSEAREGGPVGRRVRLCVETAGKVGFLLAQNLQPGTVGADAVMAVGW
ncbi:MAG: hypothetical protein ACRDLM_02215 [Gaiellaceae bacterium]